MYDTAGYVVCQQILSLFTYRRTALFVEHAAWRHLQQVLARYGVGGQGCPPVHKQ